MSYAYIPDGATIRAVGPLPKAHRRLDTDQWVLGLPTAPVEVQEACGWFEIVKTPRPADTETTTHDRSIELVAGVPTVVWTERNKTAEELNPPPTETERIADLEAALNALAGGE